jgi:3-hydroxyisobutyrate dehydrogenase-like beta-hydroxyacid dehydrogenase
MIAIASNRVILKSDGAVMSGNPIREVALIGFGEAGGIFGQDLAAAGISVAMFDVLLDAEPSRTPMLAKARNAGVRACDSLEEAIRDADLVISAVTASAAASVAGQAAATLRKGQTYLDINSVSPETKREIARILEPSNAVFVEAAVMAPVSPQRLKVPMLLGGAEAEQVAKRLQAIGMNATAISDRVGVASAVKMCRSVIIKGIEALAVESLFAARRYGAEKEVLASLAATYPHMGWDGPLPDYLISRVAEHGKRRAAEMREAAETLKNIGLEPWTALATAERHDWLVREMAERQLSVLAGESFSWQKLADAMGNASSFQTEVPAHTSTPAERTIARSNVHAK